MASIQDVSDFGMEVVCAGENNLYWQLSDAAELVVPIGAVRDAVQAVRVPEVSDAVYTDECAYSFTTAENSSGLFTSLRSHCSFGLPHALRDAASSSASSCALYLWKRIRRVPKVKAVTPAASESDVNDAEITKLAIGVEGGFQVEEDRWEGVQELAVALLHRGDKDTVRLFPWDEWKEHLPSSVRDVIVALLARVDTSKLAPLAWQDDPPKESKYAKDLPQLDNGIKISPRPEDWKCAESGMRENLWLNLSTGYIGSGRRNFDGTGGTGAALKHFEETGSKYPLVVKLGTITAQGADVYSYAPDENDAVLDPYLAEHLAHWGIDVMQQRKTAKTTDELSIALNKDHQFGGDRICESGKELEQVTGPGLIGMQNIGNSCYMNSVMQVLHSLPEVRERFEGHFERVYALARGPTDVETQLCKLGVALQDEKFSVDLSKKSNTDDSAPIEPFPRPVIVPNLLKASVANGHPDFSSKEQQDAYEYLLHVISLLERLEHASGRKAEDTSKLFKCLCEQRVECLQSNKVRYTQASNVGISLPIPMEAGVDKVEDVPAAAAAAGAQEEQPSKKQKMESEEEPTKVVPFDACLSAWLTPSVAGGFRSPVTNEYGDVSRRVRFSSFSKYLVIQMERFFLGPDWIPKKKMAEVAVPEELDLSACLGTGLQPGEEELPEDANVAPELEQPDAALVGELFAFGMGSENACKRAVLAVHNAGMEPAMNWLMDHMGDADINDPIPSSQPAVGGASDFVANEEALMLLQAMDFSVKHATLALKNCDNDGNRAAEWLFSRMDTLDTLLAEEENSNVAAAPQESKAEERCVNGKYDMVAVISHIGKNTGSGHYVCHIKKEDGKWYFFNDESVFLSQEPPLDLGYVYLFRRRD
eukprot:CAMPEP_0177681098 /NCGR_PEP_ID=MMETSP0447-20121125/30529_1 /TAXON_ID=0 /ORGANISM="Stygamoeba regulata, Strain BSH-02190019" /LENGTH=875 /DNA_ID=CAMNT_0019190481 /DNA_START=77 /DNA_END=2704 /DNA_ORIENTATION=-